MSGEEVMSVGNMAGSILQIQAEDGNIIAWPRPGTCGPIELSDQLWSSSFGALQRQARQLADVALVTVDFSQVEWADPLPMLSLCATIREVMATPEVQLRLVVGEVINVTPRRGGFLKFLVQQGFIDCLWIKERTTFVNADSASTNKNDLVAVIETASHRPIYSNSRCLTAKLLVLNDEPTLDGDRRGSTQADEIVSQWLQEIEEQCLRRFFESDPELISNVRVKLGVILLELFSNTAEHSYHRENGLSHPIGVMVRIRQSDDTHWNKKELATAIRKENQRCPRLSNFHRSSDDKWLEVFVVDNGRGLAADLDEWIRVGNPKLRQYLKKVKATTNIMAPLAKYLFSQPISRFDRTGKTSVTGLQHISFVLVDQFDFARLHCMGEWVGSTHPWAQEQHPITVSPRKQSGIENTPLGTAWHFCLRLVRTDGKVDGMVSNWNRLSIDQFNNTNAPPAKHEEWNFFDERDLDQGINRIDWGVNTKLDHPMSMWLPGSVIKQHIHEWLKFARKSAAARPDVSHFWLIGDLAPHEAKLFYEVISRELPEITGPTRLDILLVTYTWHFIGLTETARGFATWSDTKKSKLAIKGSRSIFELLRHHDSNIFWQGVFAPTAVRSIALKAGPEADADFVSVGPFLPEETIWRRDAKGQVELMLDGYLDVTEALAEPRRANIARRALRRCWYGLAKPLPCIAADSLLASMLPHERKADKNEWFAGGQLAQADHVLVNSVCVTGQTIEETCRHRGDVIHLLYHPPRQDSALAQSRVSPLNGLIALDWLADASVLRDRDPKLLPYERIPGTPYVGRGGAKAIPVRRFYRPEDSTPAGYFKHSIYGADPQETYDQFERLGLLKLGHWSYGSHHHLLTINVGKAIESESIDRGPMLRWTFEQLEELSRRGVSVVIYPSHRVTDGLVRALKRLSVENGVQSLPRDFIPVHSLGRHAQTAIRIPSPIYDRIKAALRRQQHPKAVILDDASVTGKVEREFGQLLRNAGAEEVFTLSVLTRTGIPLYRRYLASEYSTGHRFYWRWDVPSLGSRRYCPLCSAIDLATSLKESLFLRDSEGEVSSWINTWTHAPVETHWERRGLAPGPLPTPRRISFGKEWPTDGTAPVAYKLTHRTTTGLAATIAELIRVTAYKDVGLKIARHPADHELNDPAERREWLRCVAEIQLVQILLFFDDFEMGELELRMGDLVDLLMELQLQPEGSLEIVPLELQQLICLALLLAPREVLPYLMERILERAGSIEQASSRALVTVGALLRRTPGLSWSEVRRRAYLRHTDSEAQLRALEFLSRSFATVAKKESSTTAQACLILFLVLGASDRDSHSGLLRRWLLEKRAASADAVLHDLQLAASALELLPKELFHGTDSQTQIRNLTALLKDSAERFSRRLQRDESKPHLVQEMERLHRDLYLKNDGWIGIRDALAPDVQNLIAIIRKYPNEVEWTDYLDMKQPSCPEIVNPWRSGGGTILPNISVMHGKVDLKKRLFCPPLAIKMIKDYMLNVLHVPPTAGRTDMDCHLAGDSNSVKLVFRNRCGEAIQTPKPKMSQLLLASLTDLITVKVEGDSRRGEIRVTIRLPYIQALWNEVAK